MAIAANVGEASESASIMDALHVSEVALVLEVSLVGKTTKTTEVVDALDIAEIVNVSRVAGVGEAA